MGRPPKDVKKDIRACVRFTTSEYNIIKEKAAKSGMRVAAYLRQAAIQSPLRTRLTEEETHFVRQLIGMANNLNQIAKRCHQEGALRTVVSVQHIRKDLDEILRKLKP